MYTSKTQTITLYVVAVVALLMIIGFLFSIPKTTEAAGVSRGFVAPERSSFEVRRKGHTCDLYTDRPWIELPEYCGGAPDPDPDPEPEPEPGAPTINVSADPDSVYVNGTSTITWMGENVDTCEASDGWSGELATAGLEEVTVSTTTTFTLTCVGDGGTTTKSVVVGIMPEEEPEPEPEAGNVLITEVLYDLVSGGEQGSETGGANEWVEIYNAGVDPVDLMGWEIGDGSSNDVLSDSSLMLGAGEFLVVTNATSTADFWDFSNVSVMYLFSSISGGLANGGDVVKLFDDLGSEIDAVSYGSNTDAFDPSVSGVAAGNSIARSPLTTDTDSAADWVENDTPTPGS